MGSPAPSRPPRTRHALGVLAIALALVVGVAVAHNQKPIAGFATALPVPGPPAVGDCAATPAGMQGRDLATFLDHQAAGTFAPTYLSNEIGPAACAQPHYGEVVALISDPDDVEISGSANSGFTITDRNIDSCSAAANRYLTPGAPSDPSAWVPAIFTESAVIGPTERQRQAGQHWAACVTYVLSPSGDDGDTPASYRGTLRAAAETGNQRDHLGLCGTNFSDGFLAGGCAVPHRYELIATSTTDHPSSHDDALAGCQTELQSATGISNVASTTGLRADLTATTAEGTQITTGTLPAGTNLNCGITTTGTMRLRGSLRSLGSDPIPWA